jgi:membrane-associated phospholipid phosphatase
MNKKIIKKLGDVLTLALPISAIPVIWSISGLRALFLFVGIYGLGNLIVQVLKGIFDEPRPRDTVGDHVIYVHGWSMTDGNSLCSGHAMSACLPAYFCLFFIEPWWVFIPFLVLAWVCGWTRIKVKAHWFLDVFVSNLIAFNCCLLAAYLVKVL